MVMFHRYVNVYQRVCCIVLDCLGSRGTFLAFARDMHELLTDIFPGLHIEAEALRGNPLLPQFDDSSMETQIMYIYIYIVIIYIYIYV